MSRFKIALFPNRVHTAGFFNWKLYPVSYTHLIVSQRASSIQYADLIIVLDEGRPVGMGRHDELLKECPVYSEIYWSQFKKPEEMQSAKTGGDA